ncbi:MAG TPA: hypothetical protein VFV75_20510 [Candidatus Polarisedimenticolaceae bacterium]|nr:hypothetical protein [Candidatus Polarisedimenticolaceae bacterium]
MSVLSAAGRAGYPAPVVAALCLLVAVLLGVLIALAPAAAIAVGLSGFISLLILRQPTAVFPVLLTLSFLQPLLLRLIPDSVDYWLWIRRADELVLAVLLPVAIIRLLIRGRVPLGRATLLCIGTITAIGLVAAAMRETPTTVVLLDAFLLFKGLTIFVIAYAFAPSMRATAALLNAVLVFGVTAGVIGMIEMVAPALVRDLLPLTAQGSRGGQTCIVSIFEHEGQAGWFFAFVATVAFSSYVVTRRPLFLATFLFLSLCSVLTLRRKPIVGLVVMVLVFVLLGRRTNQRVRAATLLLVMLLAGAVFFGDTLVGVFIDGYQQYLGGPDPMKVARNAMYLTSFRIACDTFPLGAGFGVFGGYTSRLFYSPVYYEYGLSKVWGLSPENDHFIMDAFWPHVLGQFGFIGLAAYLALLALLWIPVLRVMRQPGSTARRILAFVCVLGFAEALVESTAQSVFETTLSAFFIFGFLAVSLANERTTRPC